MKILIKVMIRKVISYQNGDKLCTIEDINYIWPEMQSHDQKSYKLSKGG